MRSISTPSFSCVRAVPAPAALASVCSTNGLSQMGKVRMENVVKADFSDRKACCYCSDYEIRKRRAPLEANALFRSMSVSGTSTMLYHSTNYPKYPVIPTNAWSSSTVADGVSSAVASLASAGRTLCRSITMHTNSKLEQHHLDFGKFTESPPPPASRREPLSRGQSVARNPRCNSECHRDKSILVAFQVTQQVCDHARG